MTVAMGGSLRLLAHLAVVAVGTMAYGAETFRDCSECPEMVVIPAGSYQMGSPSNEEGRTDDEGPVHEVAIAESFALGRYEVTVGEFEQFVDETGYWAGDSCQSVFDLLFEDMFPEPDEDEVANWHTPPDFGQSRKHPVVCVSWNDAQAYATWLSQMTGERYRLPSESEWEYAARAGNAAARYWENSDSSGDAPSRQNPLWCSNVIALDLRTMSALRDFVLSAARTRTFAPLERKLNDSEAFRALREFEDKAKAEPGWLGAPTCSDGKPYTTAVDAAIWSDPRRGPDPRSGPAQKPVNSWGLAHMLGNAGEWTEDCWNEDYAGAPSDGGAWESEKGLLAQLWDDGECDRRVFRGGAWIARPRDIRAARRGKWEAETRFNHIGFRVARTL